MGPAVLRASLPNSPSKEGGCNLLHSTSQQTLFCMVLREGTAGWREQFPPLLLIEWLSHKTCRTCRTCRPLRVWSCSKTGIVDIVGIVDRVCRVCRACRACRARAAYSCLRSTSRAKKASCLCRRSTPRTHRQGSCFHCYRRLLDRATTRVK